jgi:gamma-glutamylcyclotransferase (GGCT)/AIG2-like uncharacterized protein YtfP
VEQLYFAYGSNLLRRAMAQRCPRSHPLERATVAGYRLVFRGFADLIADPSSTLHGALYRVTPACLRALDAYEGVPEQYRRVTLTTLTETGPCEALAYAMNVSDETAGFAPPALAYYGEIARGYADWGLDQQALRRARLASVHPPVGGLPRSRRSSGATGSR